MQVEEESVKVGLRWGDALCRVENSTRCDTLVSLSLSTGLTVLLLTARQLYSHYFMHCMQMFVKKCFMRRYIFLVNLSGLYFNVTFKNLQMSVLELALCR